MVSLAAFLETLEQKYPDEKVRGTRFEPFLGAALRASPSHPFQRVWRWDDWPGRDGADRGIDLVAEGQDGELWAIQSKLYSPDAKLGWAELATWVAASRESPWTHRLLVSTATDLTRTASKELRDDPKTHLLLGESLHSLAVDWPAHIRDRVRRRRRMQLKPHQYDAVRAIITTFRAGTERAQVHMACGTGKTLTGIHTYATLRPKLAVVLVPSLSLMSDSIRQWTAESGVPFRFLAVCSDASVADEAQQGEDSDVALDDLSSLDIPPTTDPETIRQFLDHDDPQVIFCTYQSSETLGNVLIATGRSVDFMLADEAHRTTGDATSVFATVLDDARFPAKTRLFMTATPRVFVRRKQDEELRSMDDTVVYGKVAYEIGFGRAIELGLLAEYELLVIAVRDEELRSRLDGDHWLQLEGTKLRVDPPAAVALQALDRAVNELDVRRVISFHSRVNRAKRFAAALPIFQEWRRSTSRIEATFVSGAMHSAKRVGRLKWLGAGDEARLLANARCLTEGIDVPALDGVMFADPRRSQIDIIQAVGRVMRADPSRPDKVGRIIVPVVVPAESALDGSDVFEDSAFRPIWDVVRALKAHDFRLEKALNEMRSLSALGPINHGQFRDVIRMKVLGIDDLDALHLAVVEKSTSSFWNVLAGPFAQYVKTYGNARIPLSHVESFGEHGYKLGRWCQNLRTRRTGLSQEAVDALNDYGFDWDPYETDFNVGLQALREFKEQHHHTRVPQWAKVDVPGETLSLGSWCNSRRMEHRDGRLSEDRVKRLQELGFELNPLDANFDIGIVGLRQYVKKTGHARVPHNHTEIVDGREFKLGSWCANRRTDYKSGILDADRISSLEQCGFVWDARHLDWDRGVQALRQYQTQHGDLNAPGDHSEVVDGHPVRLARWMSKRRAQRIRGRLSDARISELDELGFEWDPERRSWDEAVTALARFVADYGHAKVPQAFVSTDGRTSIKLGRWCIGRRQSRVRGSLTDGQVAQLDALGFEWDPRNEAFDRAILALRQFGARTGSYDPPQTHIEQTSDGPVRLGTWCNTARQDRKKGKLNDERIRNLDELGFDWDPSASSFDRGMAALRQFIEETGSPRPKARESISVEGQEFRIGQWTNSMRNEFKNSRLDSDRIAQLEAVGFEWNTRGADFERGLRAVQLFRDQTGNTQIPRSTRLEIEGVDFPVGAFVHNRRRLYDKGDLGNEEADALRRVGIDLPRRQ